MTMGWTSSPAYVFGVVWDGKPAHECSASSSSRCARHEALASGPRLTHVAVVEAPPTVGIPGSAEDAPVGAVFAQRTTDFDFKHASRSPTKRGRKPSALAGTATSLLGGFGTPGRRAVSSNGLLIVSESDASDPSSASPSPVKPARLSMGATPPPRPSF